MTADTQSPLEIGDDEAHAALASAASAKESEPQERAGIRYLDAFRYVFQSGNWPVNLLIGSACVLSQFVLPIVGVMLFTGYLNDVTEAIFRSPRRPYPDFDFGRFGDYLSRGLGTFVVYLLFGVLLVPALVLLYFGLIAGLVGMFAAHEEPLIGVTIAAAFTLVLLLVVAGVLAFYVVSTPVLIRVEMSQEIGQAFRFRWIGDFLRRMWIDLLLVSIFSWMTSLLLLGFGMLLVCVGAIPASVLSMMVYAHLQYQLYDLYLARGGEPVPLKPLRLPRARYWRPPAYP